MKIPGISHGTMNGSNDTMGKEALMGEQEVSAEIEFIGEAYDTSFLSELYPG